MMHNIDLILTLTGSLAAALLFGYLTHRVGCRASTAWISFGASVSPITSPF